MDNEEEIRVIRWESPKVKMGTQLHELYCCIVNRARAAGYIPELYRRVVRPVREASCLNICLPSNDFHVHCT